MKLRLAMAVALTLMLAVANAGQTISPEADAARRAVIARAHSYTHVIYQETVITGSKCSSTAIGPHALLTASHCEQPTNVMLLDETPDVKILALTRDKQDHTIYFLDTTFTTFVTLSSDEVQQGDDVFIVGNPGEFTDFYRRGYVVKVAKPKGWFVLPTDPTAIVLDLNGYFGDSGAAVFNSRGEIVSVVSAVAELKDGDKPRAKFMTALEIRFTKEQIDRASNFGIEKDAKAKE